MHVRVLMLAYACEPGRGSESEVGWRWAMAAARLGHEVTVVTRANNRQKIDAARPEYEDLPIRFEYHEAPPPFLWLKKCAPFPRLYYMAWQVALAARVRALIRSGSFDLYHHVTYVSARFPSVLALAGCRFVLGPIGGLGRVPELLVPLLDWPGRAMERARAVASRLDRLNPLWWWSMKRSRRLLVADVDTMEQLPSSVRRKSALAPAIGIDVNRDTALCAVPDTKHVLMIGELTARKGQSLGLDALAQLQHLDWSCEIIGEGRHRRLLESRVSDLGLGDRVTFCGALPREDVLFRLSRRPIVLALSLRESGGMALLEAAAAACPLVFLSLGGPQQLLGERAGAAVAPARPLQVVKSAADALAAFMEAPSLADEAGRRARGVALDHAWSAKAAYLSWLYGEAE